MNKAIVYCDGSFDPHRKIGGYGVVVLYKGTKEFSESSIDATSSTRAEMLGVIRAIESVGNKTSIIQIYTDSKVIVDVATKYLQIWVTTKWKKCIKNKDLWLRIFSLMKQHLIEWYWINGHSGNQYNDRADYLAKQSIGVEYAGIIW